MGAVWSPRAVSRALPVRWTKEKGQGLSWPSDPVGTCSLSETAAGVRGRQSAPPAAGPSPPPKSCPSRPGRATPSARQTRPGAAGVTPTRSPWATPVSLLPIPGGELSSCGGPCLTQGHLVSSGLSGSDLPVSPMTSDGIRCPPSSPSALRTPGLVGETALLTRGALAPVLGHPTPSVPALGSPAGGGAGRLLPAGLGPSPSLPPKFPHRALKTRARPGDTPRPRVEAVMAHGFP